MIRRVLSGYWFAHGDQVRDRDEQGRMLLVCERCGDIQRPQLDAETLKGPAHEPAAVLGQPTIKAQRATWFQRTKVS